MIRDVVKQIAQGLPTGAFSNCSVPECGRPLALQVIFDCVDGLTVYGVIHTLADGGVCRYHKSVDYIPQAAIRNMLENAYKGFLAFHNIALVDLPVVTVHWVCGGEVESSEPVDLVTVLAVPTSAPIDASTSLDFPFRTNY